MLRTLTFVKRIWVRARVAAAVASAVGECLHGTAFMPLIADLALALRGQYMALALRNR